MEGVAVTNRGLISLNNSPGVLERLSKGTKWAQCCKRRQGHRQSGGARAETAAPGLNDETEFTKLSASNGNALASIMGQLRSRAVRSTSPEVSLREGTWVKLICGASFEDLAEVRNLSLVYTLAGVDCIDCAADTAVVAAVVEGVNAANDLVKPLQIRRPWIMVSVNDDVDPHFRKAEFDSAYCPSDCPRPCESVCPALAIKFQPPTGHEPNLDGGVIVERCYGCGRCLSVCPLGLISARTYVRPVEAVANLIMTPEVDAIEIHTGARHLEAFESLVSNLGSSLSCLKLVAVSMPDLGQAMIPTMATLYSHMQPFLKQLNLWQLDGRPMSGDIGAGATRAAVDLAARVAASTERPQGYLQLAGGTNGATAVAMRRKGLVNLSTLLKHDCRGEAPREALVAGVAYGGYARKVVSKFFQAMHDDQAGETYRQVACKRLVLLERYPSLLIGALQEAIALVDTVKQVK